MPHVISPGGMRFDVQAHGRIFDRLSDAKHFVQTVIPEGQRKRYLIRKFQWKDKETGRTWIFYQILLKGQKFQREKKQQFFPLSELFSTHMSDLFK